MTSPVSEDSKLTEIKIEKEESKYPYFNREESGRKHNFCGVCKKDGALIYCKNCSASYHLQCHIPAADPTDVFNQQWLCYVCHEFKRNFLDGKVNRKGKKRSALEILAFAASLVNPREFELPKELQSLSIMYSESNNVDYVSDRKVEKDHCLDSDLTVPLPVRMCFQCGRSCRKAPLIACDYCPLYFHQDCLDPPLIAFPIGRWVCPNHPNHLVDQDLLTSCKIRNRIKLWDRYGNQSIDQHAIKLDFVHKYTVNSLIRTKVRLEGRPRIKVPSSIKFHYKNRSSLDSLRFCQNSFIWPMKNVGSDDEQHTDCEETDNSKIDNCIENKQIERINEVKKERKECDAITNEENHQQKAPDVDEYTSKVESKIATDNSKECNNLEFHIGYCDHNVKEGIELLERPVLEALAQQRLQQILNPHGDNYEMINCRKRASAALFSLNPKPNPPAFMTRRTFVIGNGSDCDLVLSNYGSCKFTSSKHAIIFFDEATKCYELLNYSEYGTVVDNVLYSCDYMSDEEEKTDKSTKKEKTSKMIKTILHKNEIVSLQEYAYTHKSDKILCKCSIKCNARVSKHLEEGWKGSAIIAHGSILTFGCLMFVFNTMDVFING
nr:PREDICTED: PHD finger protein 12-like [Linepithema humile]